MTDSRSPDAAGSPGDEEGITSSEEGPAADQAPIDPSWFDKAADEESLTGVPPTGDLQKPPGRAFEDRQFNIAVGLIVLYAAGNGCLIAGWYMGTEGISTMAALVGNIGTLVAAVVAFYFAEPKRNRRDHR